MPYIRKGKCIFRKDTGKKVGCSDTIENAKDYLKALYANAEDEEMTFNEMYSIIVEKAKKKKKSKLRSKCQAKAKAKYDVWPSAYASGALVKCRKVGAKNWGNSKK